jgi:hypothetical protein
MTQPSDPRPGDGAPPDEPTLFADLPASATAAPDAPDAPPRDVAPRDPEAEQAAALSEAARGAVRQPADPRIDAHLAHLGLTDGPAPARPARGASSAEPAAPAPPPAPDLTPEVQRLETLIRSLEAAHDATTTRVRSLAWSVLAIGIVAFLALVAAVIR